MKPDPLTLKYNDDVVRIAKEQKGLTEKPMMETIAENRALTTVAPDLPGVEVLEIPGTNADVQIVTYKPKTVRGVLVEIFGGGWCLGSFLDVPDSLLERAQALSFALVKVNHRLSPENPYPAGVDDCETAALWAAENALETFGSSNMCLWGDSSGAHLAVLTLLRLRDRHNLRPFRGVVLENGCYDLRLTPSARLWGTNDRRLVVTYELIQQLVDLFARGRDLSDPDISPIFAELHDMPPALFLVGSEDPFVDDTLFMESRWKLAGNDSELLVFPGGSHWLRVSETPDGELARARVWSFVSRVLQ